VTTSLEGASNDRDEVLRAPSGLFTSLDDDSIASEGRADDRAEEVMERIIPRNASGDHAQWFISQFDLLIALQRPGHLSFLRHERLLSMRKNPFYLFDGHQYLAERRINLGFPGVETCDRRDCVLVAEDILHQRPKHLPSLVKRRPGPFLLRPRRRLYRSIDILRVRGRHLAERRAGRGRVALDHVVVWRFDGGVLEDLAFPAGLRLLWDGNTVGHPVEAGCSPLPEEDVAENAADEGYEHRLPRW
jgi:hypothetical protein